MCIIITILNDFKKFVCIGNLSDGIDNYDDANHSVDLCR